ncbi:unnamed protein product [Owenia fusiformis]|uniref:UDP-glucuronosyltransferase n=1 Tax=Owenia fusiformis TaxID=6347 RepID=A0A8J1U1V2_OWEFU|nr:unnamed protein product [Owenia fusiformis]
MVEKGLKNTRAWLGIVLLMGVIPWGSGMKVLLLPAPAGSSHLSYFTAVGEELIAQGHQVGLIVTPYLKDKIPKSFKETKSSIYYWDTKITPQDLSDASVGSLNSEANREKDAFENFMKLAGKMRDDIVPFLEDADTIAKMKAENYDIVIVDGFILGSYIYIVPYKLNVPFCTLITPFVAEFMGSPALPSFTPNLMMPYTQEMDLEQRIQNFFASVMFGRMMEHNLPSVDDSLIRHLVPERPPIRIIPDLVKQSGRWLINSDPLMDYHRPIMSNIVQVGGLTIHPAKSLTKQFEDFVSKSNGFIIVSFGSVVNSIDDDVANKMIKAFKSIKYDIIWRYPGDNTITVPNNVMISKWLPQNDLLANPKAKLFITHCGNNGQIEALHHGIPMLGMPFFGDQKQNSIRMEFKGYGIHMNVQKFTSDELENNINEIISNPKYTEKIRKASRIFKSQESPRKRAVAAIKHVVDFGSDHLRPITVDMPLWKLWMLDIYASVAFGVFLILFIAKVILSFIFRRLWKFCFGKPKSD